MYIYIKYGSEYIKILTILNNLLVDIFLMDLNFLLLIDQFIEIRPNIFLILL